MPIFEEKYEIAFQEEDNEKMEVVSQELLEFIDGGERSAKLDDFEKLSELNRILGQFNDFDGLCNDHHVALFISSSKSIQGIIKGAIIKKYLETSIMSK